MIGSSKSLTFSSTRISALRISTTSCKISSSNTVVVLPLVCSRYVTVVSICRLVDDIGKITHGGHYRRAPKLLLGKAEGREIFLVAVSSKALQNWNRMWFIRRWAQWCQQTSKRERNLPMQVGRPANYLLSPGRFQLMRENAHLRICETTLCRGWKCGLVPMPFHWLVRDHTSSLHLRDGLFFSWGR